MVWAFAPRWVQAPPMSFFKKTLLSLALFASRGPIGKGARHALAIAAGWLAALPLLTDHGALDPGSLFSWLVALLMLCVSALWSMWVKKPIDGERRATARLIVEALVGHLVPAIVGAMSARGYAGGPDDAGAMAEWLGVGLVNYVRSVLQRPDALDGTDRTDKTDPLTGRPLYFDGWLLPFVLCLGLMGLSSCASRTEIPASVRDWRFNFCVELPVGEWLSGIREDSRREVTDSTGLEVVPAK